MDDVLLKYECIMKSKVEVRKFAIEIASGILGKGTADKDVVGKAMEIEAYVLGEAELPETYDEVNAVRGALGGTLSQMFGAACSS